MTAWFAPYVYVAATALLLLLVPWAAKPGKAHAARLVVGTLALFAIACGVLWVDCTPRALVLLAVMTGVGSLPLASGATRRLSDALGSARLPLYLLSLATLGALFYVYLPIIVFLTSPGELSIHLDGLLKENARDAMRVVYVGAFVYALAMGPRLRSVLTFLAVAAVALCLLYSFVMPFGYPVMNGLMFEQIPVSSSEHVLRAAADGAVVAITLLLLLLLLLRLGSRRIIGALVVVNVSLTIACIASVRGDIAPSDADVAARHKASEQPIALSTTQENVMLLFLDRLMGGFVEPILKDEPELAARLDGFTWYPKTLAAGENSIAGAHPLLGGYDYTPTEMNKRADKNSRPLREVAAESYAILPHNFHKAGYAVSVVNPRMLGFTLKGDCSFLKVDGVACGHIPLTVTKALAEEHKVPMQVLAESNYADLLVLLGLMRGAPYSMKAVLNQRGPWKKFIDHSAGTTFQEWAELKALSKLTTTTAQQKTLNVFFNALPHEPYFMAEDCKPRDKKLTVPDEEWQKRGFASLFALQHYTAARCSLLAVADYFDWMRANGVYDNTRIVIVSDHGIVGPVEDHSTRAEQGGTTDKLYVKTRSALFVKERNARGPMATSEDFVPNAEVPALLCSDVGGCVNPFLGDKPIATNGRDDPFSVTFVPWQFNQQEKTKFVVKGRMELRGKDPYLKSNWVELPAK